ncbi:MAG: VOC family protein [Myxococcales bacterium]
MSITFWNTLAVRDLERARAFYAALGFEVRAMPGGAPGITVAPTASSLVCLFREDAFRGMIPGELCDASRAHEIVQSLSCDRKDAVDQLVARAEEAGGKIIGRPAPQPYGYGGGFSDPDGHVWAVLWLAQAG